MTQIELPEKPEMVLADKLLTTEPIERSDIEALDLYGDVYIDMLMSDGQESLKKKLAQVVTHLLRPDRGAWQ